MTDRREKPAMPGGCPGGIDRTCQKLVKWMEIPKEEMEKLQKEEGKMEFHAGYIIGKKIHDGCRVVVKVHGLLEGKREGSGAFNLFNKEDTIKIRKYVKTTGMELVGLYRTDPLGEAKLLMRDKKILDEILFDIVYMVVGNVKEEQICVMDKQYRNGEIDVVIL